MTQHILTIQLLRRSVLTGLMIVAGLMTANAQAAYAQYTALTDSPGAFQGELKIFNAGTQPINGWTLIFTFSRSLTGVSGATVVSHVGTRYTVKNLTASQIIPAGGSVTISLNGTPGNLTAAEYPSAYTLNGMAIGTVPLATVYTTSTFTYQGRLSDGAVSANGSYDFQFILYDQTGSIVGTLIEQPATPVVNGVFTVLLDFGAAPFTGPTRFLEIRVRPGGSTGAYTILTPLQPLTSVPLAIRSQSALAADSATTAATATNAANAANSAQLGGVAANQYVLTTDSRLTTTIDITGSGTIGGNLTVGGTLASGCRSGFTAFAGGRLCVSPMQTSAPFLNAVALCAAMSARVGNSSDAMQTLGTNGFNYFGGILNGWLADHIADDTWATWNVANPAANFDGAPQVVSGSSPPSLPYRCVY